MPKNNEFVECATCAKKPGSPRLCPACTHNRAVIAELRHALSELPKAHDLLEPALNYYELKSRMDALSRLAVQMKERAGDLYAIGMDDQAQFVRGLGRTLQEQADQLHPEVQLRWKAYQDAMGVEEEKK